MRKASRDLVALPRPAGAATRPRPRAKALVSEACEVLRQQADALRDMAERVDASFADAVETILATPGRVIFLGLGKSGHIARKLAATFSSTGTPSLFVHAAEAHHGDLGMVTERDAVVLVSCSGETGEVVDLVPHLRAMAVPILALVGNPDSTLADEADIALDCGVDREACPNNLAPTTSTLAAMAMGDALAVALMSRRDFQAADFARVHPGGSLGHRLRGKVADAMHTSNLPIVAPTDTVGDAIVTINEGQLGLVLVMAGERLVGLVTDGDLRRGMQRHDALLSMPVSEIMTLNPVTISEDTPLDVAHRRMVQMKLKALVVLDARGRVSGVVDVFDDE